MSSVASAWAPSPARLELTAGSVHVWLAVCPAEAPFDRFEGELPPDERRRAQRFMFDRDRRRFVFAHRVLRATLARYLDVAPGDIEFSNGKYGKPQLAGACGGRLEFNLSHSDHAVLVAISGAGPVGVDVEAIRVMRDRDDIARRTFAAGEFERLCRLDDEGRTAGFFNCWTRKEAFVKAIGEGLSHPLDRFEVTLAPGEPACLVHIDGDAQRAAAWAISTLPDLPGFTSALAVPGPATVSCFRWTEQSAPVMAAVSERCTA